jgi:hypothetical protein
LCHDPKISVARNQAIHQVGCEPVLVMVFENEFSVGATARQMRRELDLDLTESFLHLLDLRELLLTPASASNRSRQP